MSFQKRCIVHIPYKLIENGMAAPMLRPIRMIEGFKAIGYQVTVVEGTVAERKEQIKKIKKLINANNKYDFMYAESSTIPTLLTEKNHLPLHPLVDFNFFHFVKRKHIPIGLFYRDIYWKFDSYKQGVPFWKSFLGIQFYKYDMWQYKKLLNCFYIPNYRVLNYLKEYHFDNIAQELPPGCDNLKNDSNDNCVLENVLNVFYVGGLGEQYQIEELMKAVQNEPKIILTICCREVEWEREKNNLGSYLSDNIHIIHKKNTELVEYYKNADVCSLLFKEDVYRKMAMPYKAFEYLANLKPVLATKGTAIGDFIEKFNIGWVIDYDANEIKKVLHSLLNNRNMIEEKRLACIRAKEENTWMMRAKKVAKDLNCVSD